MVLAKSERVTQILISVYKTELQRNFLAFTLQTDVHAEHQDIDYAVLLKNIDSNVYERLAKINARFEKKYNTTLDMFLYEVRNLRDSVNPWSAEIVRRNTIALYGKNFWLNLRYAPNEIFRGAFTYLEENREKFRRYIKNIGRQRRKWIVVWALDHLFVAVKVYNSLFGFWSLGKKHNLLELHQLNPDLARRLEAIYRSRYKEASKDPLHFLAECYDLSEVISTSALKRTVRSFLQSHKRSRRLASSFSRNVR